ncbi:MAG: transcriptional regulator [Desulfobacterales bacterium]|nr:transcriptional regulator [Desulfobacterales bacterium]
MARGDQLGRQWQIIQALTASRAGKSVPDLAEELECHSRTVYRDIEALEKAGFPIYNEKRDGKNVWFMLDAEKHQMPIPLNLTELMALYFGRDMLKVLKGTVFYDSLKSFFQKVKTMLPAEYINFLEQIEKNLHIGQRPYKQFGAFKDLVDQINSAIESRQYIEILYYTMSRNEEALRKVAPYHIWFFDGTFYLIGYCKTRKSVRLFALDRINALDFVEESFEIPDDFSAEDFMRTSFGVFQGEPSKVKIWFDADIAGYIREKVWHETQQIHTQDDGSILFEAEVAGTDEIKFWLLGWGSKAMVIKPSALKDEIGAEAEKMAGLYK